MKPKVELLDSAPPQTASAHIVADANKIEYEIDKRGRRIGVKQLKFIEIHKLTKAIGGDTASNSVAFAQVLAAASVADIDGDPVPLPGTTLQVEALMTRLGLDGVAAVSAALERFSNVGNAGDAEIKN